jgi:transcriptional antiterminator NusG
VVVTEPQQERAVAEDLSQIQIETYVPMRRTVEVRKDRKIEVDRPLLPRYVLAGAPVRPGTTRAILDARHVREVIHGSPQVLALEVADLRAREVAGEFDDAAIERQAEARKIAHLVVGARISIIDGPFASFSGLIEDVDYGAETVSVELSIFGRLTRTRLAFGQVAPTVKRRSTPVGVNPWGWIKEGARVEVVDGMFAGQRGAIVRAHFRRQLANIVTENGCFATLQFSAIQLAGA